MNTTAEASRTATEAPPPPTGGSLERMPRSRETIVVESRVPTLDTAMFEHMQRIAVMMAQSSLVPAHLNSVKKVGGVEVEISAKEAIANCFLVVNQAVRWSIDPFAAAQSAYTTKGKLGWEGKLIAAVINSHPLIEERLHYAYSGTGEARKVIVSAKLKGEKEPRTVEGTVAAWKTTGSGSPWDRVAQWDQQLSYRGAREWGRRHLPEAMLGVFGDDEIIQFEATERTLAGAEHAQDRPQRGTAGLKAALDDAPTDATIIDEKKKGAPAPAGTPPAAKDAAPVDTVKAASTGTTAGKSESPSEAAPEKKAKPMGTLERLEHYKTWFGKITDPDELDLARDEANGYEWAAEDAAVLNASYEQRKEKIGKL